MTTTRDRFAPREGALLDLASLEAIAHGHSQTLGAWLRTSWPGVSNLVLDGLEIRGEWVAGGPPGTLRPTPSVDGVLVSPGTALVSDRNGRFFLLRIEEPLEVAWPTSSGSAVSAVLVLMPESTPAQIGGDLMVARETVGARLGFVRHDQTDLPHLLPLASSIGNGRDWATDHRRIWQPEHDATQLLLKRFEQLEQLVWSAEPEGGVWDRQVLGRNWVRYQTVAASALQAARLQMEVNALTTGQRVRLFAALRRRLLNSVERVATELVQLIGPPEGAGPYRSALGLR